MSKAPPMNQTCEIGTQVRNRFGDYLNPSWTETICHLRYITDVRRSTQGEERQADAMVWLPADTNVAPGSLIRADGVTFQCERVTKARDLYSSQIHFLKCLLEIINVGVS